jgi:hypothetical protein
MWWFHYIRKGASWNLSIALLFSLSPSSLVFFPLLRSVCALLSLFTARLSSLVSLHSSPFAPLVPRLSPLFPLRSSRLSRSFPLLSCSRVVTSCGVFAMTLELQTESLPLRSLCQDTRHYYVLPSHWLLEALPDKTRRPSTLSICTKNDVMVSCVCVCVCACVGFSLGSSLVLR